MTLTLTPDSSPAETEAYIREWRKNRKERLRREAAAKIAASLPRPKPKVVTDDGVVICDADVPVHPVDLRNSQNGAVETVHVRRPDPEWLPPLKLKNPDEPHGIRNPYARGSYDLELPRDPQPPSRDIDPMGIWSRNDD